MMELPPVSGDTAVLLLSGGIDSTALAAWVQPAAALFIDYGQRPASSEARAARAVAQALGIPFDRIHIDLSMLGSGLLLDDAAQALDATTGAAAIAPSPEWWPLRNQLLCSIAAAWALSARPPAGERIDTVLTATVASDAARHVDGTSQFYEALDAVTRMQEGNIRVLAPVASLSAEEVVRLSGVPESILGWTHSCHRGLTPCASCPGCWKREQVLTGLGILGYEPAETDSR
ncbi:MAG: 7-cyano-7-deazaguanine synthase [Propionibacteriales bacterium]|nr:7-cyano-7-deazaguanine synthase [Propionibacteriales bacterium]